ncbi:ABC transporter permease, partial [Streptomyces lonegramiae]
MADGWNGIGRQTQFYGETVKGIGDAVFRYPGEVVRHIAQMSLGVGALAVIGGTIVIVGFLTLSAGSLIAVQAYSQLEEVGVEALAGFTSAFLNVRLVGPLVAGIGLAATIGAGATAQLGAMRI